MPRGAAGAQRAGSFSGGSGFIQKPKGITYFSLKNDGDQAVVRFLQQHEEIEWVAQWKTAPKPGFPYGEKLPKVDQHEDGTPDPGYALNLKNTWTGFLPLIWRQAPQYQKDGQGNFVKDGNDNRILIGYQDQIALWEHSFPIYQTLGETETDYRGLMSRDFLIKRIGARGSNKVTYKIVPYPIDAQPSGLSQQDMLLAQTQMIDIRPLVRVPTYDELFTYLNGGQAPDPTQAQIGGQVPPAPPQPGMPGAPGMGLPGQMPPVPGQPQPGGLPAPPPPAAAPPAWPAQPGQQPMPPTPAQPDPQFYPQAPPLTAPAAPVAPQPVPFQTQPPGMPAPPQYPPQPAPPQPPMAPPTSPSPYGAPPAQQPGGDENDRGIPGANPFFTS